MFWRKRQEFSVRPFDVAGSSDPEAQAVLLGFLNAAAADPRSWPRPKVQDVAGGEELLRKDAAWNRRCLLCLSEQEQHWLAEVSRLTESLKTQHERVNLHLKPAGKVLTAHLSSIHSLSGALARRRLPLSEDDLTKIVAGAKPSRNIWWYSGLDVAAVLKQVEWHAEQAQLGQGLRSSLSELRVALDGARNAARLQARIDHLLAQTKRGATNVAIEIVGEVPAPAPTGNPRILTAAKRYLGVPLAQHEAGATELVGPDQFPLRADSPLRAEHAVLSAVFDEVVGTRAYHAFELKDLSSTKSILKASDEQHGRFFLAACERAVQSLVSRQADQAAPVWQSHYAARHLTDSIGRLAITFNRDEAFDALLLPSALEGYYARVEPWMVAVAERCAREAPLSAGERYIVHRLRCVAIREPPMGVLGDLAKRLSRLLDGDATLLLVPGEHWTDALHKDIAQLPPPKRAKWIDLVRHAATASSASPSAKWQKQAKSLVKALTGENVRARLESWLPQVAKGRAVRMVGGSVYDSRGGADTVIDGNATALRGLVGMLTIAADDGSPRLLADLLSTCLKKVPGVGPRCVKVANACVWSLGEMATSKDEAVREAALGQLARLKARVTFRTTLKAIEKALDKAAERAGMSRDDLEELGVPSFGFEAGVRREELGGATAELRVEGNKVSTTWTNEKGKAVKAPPTAVKRDFKEDLKELKQAVADAEGILLAGRDRLDNLYLLEKSWKLTDWRERYLTHGLIGTIARRLIWTIDGASVLFEGDKLLDVSGRPLEFGETAELRLWHPIGRDPQEVTAWRQRLTEAGITQPFKQAHREVYLLTDAERNTGSYSNRFAAHIVRQHQFNALCAARGWRNKLRLMVDDVYEPPFKLLPTHGLRAEFWVEPVGDNYGTDTTDSGAYLHLATDQVRFYRTGAGRNLQHAGGGRYETQGPAEEGENHPLPLDQVSPLAFSEILRDVDLFVGVASVGNDPTWQDGGPQGRFRDYWHDFSFGDLSQTAKTRKAVLEGLVPRLTIAGRCSFNDKFLIVRGDVRAYKIHLGSGNILMEPNDQYLCIVPDQRPRSGPGERDGGMFLPFEGDRTLSVILSKALLLAEDTKIKDPTILSQIGRKL